MRLIRVLGPDCPQACELAEDARQAVRELGLEADIERVTDMDVITLYAVMATPALVVDGRVQAAGRVLPAEEIRKLLAGPGQFSLLP